MKKLLGLLAVAPMAITACGGSKVNDYTTDTPRIYVLEGPTGIGSAKLSENDDYDYTVRAGSDAYSADILKCDFEVATVPIDQAWTLSQNDDVSDDCGLQVAGIVASNMLQFVTPAGHTAITGDNHLAGMEIWVPASPTVIAIMNEFVKAGTWADGSEPTIVGKPAADIIAEMKTTTTTVVGVLPEPAVTAQVNGGLVRGNNVTNITGITVVDRPIGVMAINKTWAENSSEQIEAIMAEYKTSVDFMKDVSNIDAAAKLTTDLDITPSEVVAKDAIPNSAIQWIVGDTMMTEVRSMLNDLIDDVVTADIKDNFFYEVPTNA